MIGEPTALKTHEKRPKKRRALSSALRVFRRGCFVPDLTRLAEPLCEGTRRGQIV